MTLLGPGGLAMNEQSRNRRVIVECVCVCSASNGLSLNDLALTIIDNIKTNKEN